MELLGTRSTIQWCQVPVQVLGTWYSTVLFPCSMHYNIPLFKFKVPLEVSPPYGKTVWKGMEPDAIKQCHRHGLLGPTDFGIFVFLNSLSAICHLP